MTLKQSRSLRTAHCFLCSFSKHVLRAMYKYVICVCVDPAISENQNLSYTIELFAVQPEPEMGDISLAERKTIG